MTRRRSTRKSAMNVARRQIWLLLLVVLCAIASIMGMATSTHLASSFSSPPATPGSGSTPAAQIATSASPVASPMAGLDIPAFPSRTTITDIDHVGLDIAKHALPAAAPLANKRVYDMGSVLNDENEKTLEGAPGSSLVTEFPSCCLRAARPTRLPSPRSSPAICARNATSNRHRVPMTVSSCF